MAELWTGLAATNAPRAQRAVAEYIQAGDSALPFLAKALPPVTQAEMRPIAAWIADLDSEEYARREAAARELKKIGAAAVPALTRTLKTKPTLEVRKRITALLEAIGEKPPSGQELRSLRVLQVLESVGTVQARLILEGLSCGAVESRRTQEAKTSLRRLTRRCAQP